MKSNVKVTPRPQVGITASVLKAGEYARVTLGSGYFEVGEIVLKTKLGLISLTDPDHTVDNPFANPTVERLNTGDIINITVGFTAEFERKVLEISNHGSNKINAIKYVRECTNWGLKESKDYVDSLLSRSIPF